MELVSTISMEAGEHEAVLDIPPVEGEYLFVVRNNQANDVLLKEID